jgi:hypothetical protein
MDDRGDLADAGHDLAQGLAGRADEVDPLIDVMAAGVDEFLDLASRIRSALGKGANFGRDDGKALACVTGAGRLDPGVEREQVGLERDPVDHVDDLGDFLRRVLDVGHGRDCVIDDAPAFGRFPMGFGNRLVDLDHVRRVVFDKLGHVAHRPARFLNGGGLLFGAAGKVVRCRADFVRSAGNRARRLRDDAQRFFERRDGLVELLAQGFPARAGVRQGGR